MAAKHDRAVTPTARTAFRVTSAGITGLATFGAIAATGWLAAQASGDYTRAQEEKAAQVAAAAKKAAAERTAWLKAHPVVRVVEHRRPHRTVVRTVTVASGSVAPGRGGTIRRTSSTAGSTSRPASSGSTTTHASSGGGGTVQPAAPPPPPPAPSSGS